MHINMMRIRPLCMMMIAGCAVFLRPVARVRALDLCDVIYYVNVVVYRLMSVAFLIFDLRSMMALGVLGCSTVRACVQWTFLGDAKDRLLLIARGHCDEVARYSVVDWDSCGC